VKFVLVCADCDEQFETIEAAYNHAVTLSTEEYPHGGFDIEPVL